MIAIWIALAGGLGATLRSLTDQWLPATTFPRATFVVNVIGSFTLGLLVGITASTDAQQIIGTGLLGGFTTFSSASLAAAQAWLEQRRTAALLQAVAMAVLCVAAAALGLAVT